MVVLPFSPRRLCGFGVVSVAGLGASSTGMFSRCRGGIVGMFRAIFLAMAVELRGGEELVCCCLSVIVRKARVHLGESLHWLSCRW